MAGLAAVVVLALSGCGDDGAPSGARPSIVVSTSILGDVVSNLVGDEADVEVLMAPNVDPHDFAPSARQAASLREADVVVVNGAGFEAGLVDVIDGAEADGATVIEAIAGVELLELGEDDDHDHDDGDDHDHGDEHDPHFFTDPARMAQAVRALGDRLADEVPQLDTGSVRQRVRAYAAELESLDREVEDLLAVVPDERRILVTNHDVFAYFADRYGFEVLGTVIPGTTTLAEPSAADLSALADAIAAAGVPAIFAEASAPNRLAEALAGEGADVEVVGLYTESLGAAGSDADTYVAMVRTNAERIAAALGRSLSDDG